MGPFAAGNVVLVRCPFSDLSQSKRRPAVILADASRGDWILCQITSNPYSDPTAVRLDVESFCEGSLPVTSFARPAKLFTASENLITTRAGTLIAHAHALIVEAVIALLRPNL